MFYITRGNIPSRWANSMQTMKMAEALGQRVSGFRLLTQAHPDVLAQGPFDFESWYGIHHPFEIVRLPNPKLPPTAEIATWDHPAFDKMAACHARESGARLVYSRSTRAGAYAVELGIDTVIECHNPTGSSSFRPLDGIKGHDRLRGVVTISDLLKEQFVAAGIPEERILVWPDAVNPEAFAGLPDRTEIRRRLDLPHDRFIATYCGHLYPRRGIKEIVRSAAMLPDILFLLVGGTVADIETQRQKVEKLGLTNVRLVGFVENRWVPAHLAAADVLLMPYSARCSTAPWMSPMKLFEYMASGVPVVASDLPALHQHLVHEHNSVLVPPDDAAALADGIARVRADPPWADALAAQASRDVQSLTWSNRATAILDRFG